VAIRLDGDRVKDHAIMQGLYQLDESLMRQHTWEIIRSGQVTEYPRVAGSPVPAESGDESSGDAEDEAAEEDDGDEAVMSDRDDLEDATAVHTLVRAPLGENGKPLRRCCCRCSSGRGKQKKKLSHKCGACNLFFCYRSAGDGHESCFVQHHRERDLPFDLGV